MGIPDYLTCLLRNLCAGQGATVRARHGTTDWFQIGKGVHQGCIPSPCFNVYAEYIKMLGWMKHKLESGLLGEISITSDMQMIPPLWQKVKSNWKASKWKWEWQSWLKAQHSESSDHGIWSHHQMEIDGESVETVSDFIFGGLQNPCRWWLKTWN